VRGVTEVHGNIDGGFEAVRDAFARNFDEGLEVGAAFSVFQDDRPLVDLWAGETGQPDGAPWQRDTLQLIYSGSKGLVAICILILVERGQIDLETSVSRYWPAFGKPEILVRNVVSHTARLPGFRDAVAWQELLDNRHMARRLEDEAPFEDSRCVLTYHPLTYGWLCGELVRRVDGRSLGQFFSDEVAGALQLDIWFGLPEQLDPRMSVVSGAPDNRWGVDPTTRFPTLEEIESDRVFADIWYNPPLFGADLSHWNTRALRGAQMPGANAIGTARSIARLYGAIASGGAPLLLPETVRLGATQLSLNFDRLLHQTQRFGVGWALQTESRGFGRQPDAFGHSGAGGSLHGAWPSLRIGFSYTMNRLRDPPDPRAQRLLDALGDALGVPLLDQRGP
jgi:CubicO group peptidase (beta-lactamase class C family)